MFWREAQDVRLFISSARKNLGGGSLVRFLRLHQRRGPLPLPSFGAILPESLLLAAFSIAYDSMTQFSERLPVGLCSLQEPKDITYHEHQSLGKALSHMRTHTHTNRHIATKGAKFSELQSGLLLPDGTPRFGRACCQCILASMSMSTGQPGR